MEKKKSIRKNRFKKDPKLRRRKILGSLAAGLKFVLLIAAILGFSALFMVGYAAVTRSDYFRTDNIKVRGLTRLSQNGILAQAKIKPGENLLALNLGLVRKRLLAHPWIAAARVAREIPGTLVIDITEHQALAMLDLGGRKFMMNTQGRIFKESGPDDPQDLPLVTGIVYADISLGEDALSPVLAAVVQVLQLSRDKKSAIPYAQIRRVDMDRELGVTLTVWEDQRRIRLGLDHFETKYQRIKQLLPHLRHREAWQGFETIDANNPDRIVVQLGSSLQKQS